MINNIFIPIDNIETAKSSIAAGILILNKSNTIALEGLKSFFEIVTYVFFLIKIQYNY